MLWLVFTIVPVLLACMPQVLQTSPVAPAKNRLQSNSILDIHFTNIDRRYLKYFTNHRMITGNCNHFPGFCSKVMLIKMTMNCKSTKSCLATTDQDLSLKAFSTQSNHTKIYTNLTVFFIYIYNYIFIKLSNDLPESRMLCL